MYTGEVDFEHEHHDVKHEHELERKLPLQFFTAAPCGRLTPDFCAISTKLNRTHPPNIFRTFLPVPVAWQYGGMAHREALDHRPP